ncbi:MAG: hypothetical protein PUF37_05360 [Prevotellaceae bacterium]|nr:hypothetical protein [Prevotellaceae bacterium]
MSKNEFTLARTGKSGNTEHYRVVPQGVGRAVNSLATEYGANSSDVFDEDNGAVNVRPITVGGVEYKYVPFGADDMLPYRVRDILLGNMITAQCQSFNILACYGQGIRFVDRKTHKDTDDSDIRDFCLANSLNECFMEQCTDMKFYYFSVTCIILSRDGKKIVQVRNKDACYVRFEYAPSTQSGTIEHVFFGDFRIGHFEEDQIEVIPLLNYWDPLGDLEVRMGRRPDPVTGLIRKHPVRDRKFAILSAMPTPGRQYYPVPYWSSAMRDAWLDIYRLIGISKRFMIKNTSAPRVQIEVHEDYWENVCDNEGINDPEKRKQRKEKEKQNIIDFVCGVQNAGKALVSSYYVDPNGKENRMVRINTITDGSKKEGGNWSDDMEEAANAICFAFGVHPNLVGATPGKSQMNNSGSDKRELFTLKQAIEKPFHDVMSKPYHVILHYNGWSDKYTVDVPMIQLTTLDEKKDQKKVSTDSNSIDNGDNNQ